uniref:coiled-coil domain-containing protein 162-like n=1 Tax=Euleptes europaea TaxID=460621 RepID=UPI00254179EA
MSQYSLRSQIIAYYNSIKALLEDFPSVRDKYFIMGLPQEKKGGKEKLENDPRSFHPRPRCLLSADGRSFLNLWFIPHPSETLFMFKMLPEKAGYKALRLTLQIVAAFHDIVSYIFSFAQLGSAPGCFDYLCLEHLTADWGGTEQIGMEFQELQKMIDNLHNPSDPNKVAQMLSLHREIIFLRFDAALRHSMRKAFLSSGKVSAYQSVTDHIYHGLPPLSSCVVRSAFASQLLLPQPLDPYGHRTLMLFPWRTFLANGGPFPVIISNLNPINNNMQLCLCGLNDEDRRAAHGELVGMQFEMEDILRNNYEVLDDHGECRTSFAKQGSGRLAEVSGKPSGVRLELPDSVASCSLLKSYLLLWKQLEVSKTEWGRLKLKADDINTVPLYKQFSEVYNAEILYPAIRSVAIHLGIEDEFEGFVTTSQCICPLKEVSEVELKTQQLKKLLESLEIHMIHDVQKKINKEVTLVISEKAREERNLPTELWKHRSMQENFSVTRPEIVESFIQRLMEDHQETDAEITIGKDHLRRCLTALGCDIMARERSNFETYSMFYENILQQQQQLLYQKEQEMHATEDKDRNAELGLSQVAELSHEMIMEITALRAKFANLQREDFSLKEQIRKEVQEDYSTLIQNLFLMCLQLKGKLDEYRLSINRCMFEIISEVRRDGVDKMIDLKKKFGSIKDNSGLREHLAQQGQLQELRDENSRLGKLVCKLKTMHCWKETVQKAQLSASLREMEKEATENKKECLKYKMMAEQEVVLFRQQLKAARKALAQSQAENKRLRQQLDKQEHLLQEAEHRMNQAVHRRQKLDQIKTENLERMLEDLGERELKLRCLSAEADKSSKIRQLQEKKVKKEIHQIRTRLIQERSLKLDAFQKVDELHSQLYDMEAATSQRNLSAGSAPWVHNTGISVFTLTRDFKQH